MRRVVVVLGLVLASSREDPLRNKRACLEGIIREGAWRCEPRVHHRKLKEKKAPTKMFKDRLQWSGPKKGLKACPDDAFDENGTLRSYRSADDLSTALAGTWILTIGECRETTSFFLF